MAKTVVRQILIEHGAKVDVVDGIGWAPLHWAASDANSAMVEVHSSHSLVFFSTLPITVVA